MGVVKDRFVEYIRYKGITQREFYQECGLSPGYMDHISHYVGPKKIASIRRSYPDLNIEWLTKGVGNMLIGDETPIDESGTPLENDWLTLRVRIAELEAENRLLYRQVADQKEIIDGLLKVAQKGNNTPEK